MNVWRILTALTVIALVGGACWHGLRLENRLIFFPEPWPGGWWETDGLPLQDAWFESADGTRLHGWYLRRADPIATVLFAHGNAGNLSHRRDVALGLHAMGASVLLFDYRGFGRSEGSPDERGVIADARAARDWLAASEGLAPRDVVLHGRSIGAAVVVTIAGEDGARGLVVENGFTSLADVARIHYPGWVVALLLSSEFDARERITHYAGPLLVIHGDADRLIPIELGTQLYEAAPGDKRLVIEAGVGHNSPSSRRSREAIADFLAGLPPVGTAPVGTDALGTDLVGKDPAGTGAAGGDPRGDS